MSDNTRQQTHVNGKSVQQGELFPDINPTRRLIARAARKRKKETQVGYARRAARIKAKQAERVKAGSCRLCDNPPVPGGELCQRHEDARVNRRESRRGTTKGKCNHCGKPPLPGRSRCKKHMDEFNAKVKIRTAERKAAGICYLCGKNPADPPSQLCAKCLKRGRENGKKRRAERRAAGLCLNCGKIPHLPGTYACEVCYLKTQANVNFGTTAEWEFLLKIFNDAGRRCVYSGLPIEFGTTATLDHRVPLTRGGSLGPENVQWIHAMVNQMKWNYLEDEFLKMAAKIAEHRKSLTPP